MSYKSASYTPHYKPLKKTVYFTKPDGSKEEFHDHYYYDGSAKRCYKKHKKPERLKNLIFGYVAIFIAGYITCLLTINR